MKKRLYFLFWELGLGFKYDITYYYHKLLYDHIS